MSFFIPKASTSVKFPQIGASVTGEITEISDPMQATKFEDGSPDFWPSGDPVMQVRVTLQTAERDPEIEDDDGTRNLWVRQSSQVLYAISNALKAAGQKDLNVGGKLQVTYVGDDPNSKNPRNPKKLYSAVYQAPPAGGGMFTQEQPAQQAPQAPALDPEVETNIRTLIGMGIDTNSIVNSLANPAVTHQVVDALRN